jgi:MrcB-like, N-terminal domain/Domain of unknown function (DUF3883)
MQIRDLMREIERSWPAYHLKVRVDSNDPVYAMVVEQFPRILQQHAGTYENIVSEGSTGAGNITAAPWIALFDRRLTTTATSGYYAVYLFSTDLSTVTLCLAFGTTQFEEQFGGPTSAFPRMRAAVARLQEMFNHLIPAHLNREPIDLGARPRQKLHYAYQQSSILSFAPYRIDALPEEAQLVTDLRELVELYTRIVSDPLDASVERLVEAVVQPVSAHTIEVREFEPRLSERNLSETSGKQSTRRYSPESRKVGDAGERIVVDYERERLKTVGRRDLADRVRWHGPKGEYFGWDITSFDDNGAELFIEVKSCVGKAILGVSLTVNEWEAACDEKRRDRYYIYIVTSALSATPTVERLRNPASYVKAGRLSCEAIVYQLELRENETVPANQSECVPLLPPH